MEQKQRIRIKDIALKAGTSVGTVDRVLHNRGEVNEETREKIQSIVKELNYKPNILAKSLAAKKTIKIAALIPDYDKNNPYWELPAKGILNAETEINDFNASVEVFRFNATDEASFKNATSQVLKVNPDGVLYIPVFKKVSLEFNTSLTEKNIPYVFFDIDIEDEKPLAYFGQDAWQSGFISAKLMHQSINENGLILVLNLANNKRVSHHLLKREKGFMDFFAKHNTKNIHIIKKTIDLLQPAELDAEIASFHKTAGRDGGIFVTGSRVYKVAKAVEKTKINTLITGYDLIDENKAFLMKGVIDFIISQNPEKQGYNGIMALFRFLNANIQPSRVNFSPIDIIIKENAEYYL
jgi:LacI family transcriptional regulator